MKTFFDFKSRGGLFPHTHVLRISSEDLQSHSEEGLLLTTSTEYSLFFKHSHQIRISKEELQNIKDGQTVVVFDTDKKRHSFSIQIK